jgi:hypothetical protein
MHSDKLEFILDQLDRALRSCVGARDRQEAAQALRHATDQARRVLNNIPPDRRDVERRRLARHLTGAIELAEGSRRQMSAVEPRPF